MQQKSKTLLWQNTILISKSGQTQILISMFPLQYLMDGWVIETENIELTSKAQDEKKTHCTMHGSVLMKGSSSPTHSWKLFAKWRNQGYLQYEKSIMIQINPTSAQQGSDFLECPLLVINIIIGASIFSCCSWHNKLAVWYNLKPTSRLQYRIIDDRTRRKTSWCCYIITIISCVWYWLLFCPSPWFLQEENCTRAFALVSWLMWGPLHSMLHPLPAPLSAN